MVIFTLFPICLIRHFDTLVSIKHHKPCPNFAVIRLLWKSEHRHLLFAPHVFARQALVLVSIRLLIYDRRHYSIEICVLFASSGPDLSIQDININLFNLHRLMISARFALRLRIRDFDLAELNAWRIIWRANDVVKLIYCWLDGHNMLSHLS